MFIINESEKEFRQGNSGPKYLLKGDRMNFGIIRLAPGEKLTPHFYQIMEENFFVVEGEPEIRIDGSLYRLKAGDFVHCEPAEVHALSNPGSTDARLLFMLAPSTEGDKIDA